MKKFINEWNGFKKLDDVRVLGVRGKYRFGYVEIVDGEVKTVFVYGGIPGHSQARAFTPERVVRPVKRRTRRVLSDAVTEEEE